MLSSFSLSGQGDYGYIVKYIFNKTLILGEAKKGIGNEKDYR